MMRQIMVVLAGLLLGVCGCSTPQSSEPASPPGHNPEHVRKAAQAMCASLLGCPAITNLGRSVRIKISDVEDNTHLVGLDGNIFVRRFRAELNAVGGGRLQFLDSSVSVGEDRAKILKERQRQQVLHELRQIAGYIARSAEIRGRKVVMAAVSALHADLVGMKDEDFISLMREEVVRAGKGNVRFLSPNEVMGSDYWLTGQFYRLENGQVRLNVMLTKPDTSVAVCEFGAEIRRVITDNSESCDFILSGELSQLSSRRQGVSSEYVLISFKLVDPESNVMVWEGAYEIEYVSREGLVYR